MSHQRRLGDPASRNALRPMKESEALSAWKSLTSTKCGTERSCSAARSPFLAIARELRYEDLEGVRDGGLATETYIEATSLGTAPSRGEVAGTAYGSSLSIRGAPLAGVLRPKAESHSFSAPPHRNVTAVWSQPEAT